ncbi:MAG: polysaccharide deacetylase family protein [Eubacteriales bacterium]|nr:polysaccharide deacetylase family protein [Eubacteriales bacterium]
MKGIFRKLVLAAMLVFVLGSFATCGAANTKIPILMYHDLTADPAKTNSMTVTDERFRLDMEYLQQFGYTPLQPADLLAIRSGVMEIPEKPVMVTFDDGYRSNYDYAYPILQNTGMKATLAVVAFNMRPENDTDETRHSLTWGEIREMSDSGVFEIGSHTYNLHNPQYNGMSAPDGVNGVMRRAGESQSAYNARVGSDLTTSLELIRQYTGKNVNYFSYPFGAGDSWMQQLLQDAGIGVSTLTNSGQADLAGSLYGLPRYRITMNKPVSELLRQSASAAPAMAAVSVNGQVSKLPAYNIGGNNYVRVRDVAVLLQNTASHFDVRWNSAQGRVELASFSAYTPLGTENKPLPAGSRNVRSITEPTVADGVTNMVAAYNIDGSTYYKLRSLGDLCGFLVDWDSVSQMITVNA